MSAHNLPFQINEALFHEGDSIQVETADGVIANIGGIRAAKPTDADTGWLKGAKVIVTTTNPGTYVNIGDEDSALFVLQASVEASASQAAVATTPLTVGGTYSQAEIEAIITRLAAVTTLANALRTALINNGTIKGAA